METKDQIPLIRKVFEDEKWLLGERLGRDPGPHNQQLITTLTDWVLARGGELRERK